MSPGLADYLTRRANDAFRGLAYYEGDTVDVVHTREDLGDAEMRERAGAIHRAVRPRSEASALDELGAPYATVQMRDKAVILHFPVTADSGYLVGLEPDVARDLSAFVSDCIRIIEHANGRADD